MVYSSEERSRIADKMPRDTQGQFIKADSNPVETASSEVKTETPIETITHPDVSPDEPLVSFKINNPFKKLIAWLNDIRKKQTTTFDLKIKVPLIALPVFLFVVGSALQGVFSLGRYAQKQETATIPTPTPIVIIKPTAIPEPILISRIGIIKATYQVTGLLPSIIPVTSNSQTSEIMQVDPEITLTPTEEPPSLTLTPTITPTPTPAPSRYVLVTRSDQIIFLLAPPDISFNIYLNKRVLVTGLFDKMTSTLKISKVSDIEVLQ